MTSLSEEEISSALSSALLDGDNDEEETEGLDEDMITYLSSMLSELSTEDLAEGGEEEGGAVFDAISPFLESIELSSVLIAKACREVSSLASKKIQGSNTVVRGNNKTNGFSSREGGTKKLTKGVSMADHLNTQTEAEIDANNYMWGTDKANSNEVKDAFTNKESSKDKRKAKQELEKTRREYEAKVRALEAEEEENNSGAVAAMVLPDYDTGRNERDIQVQNVNISLDNGRALLDDAELRFSHKHRYGLVGKNGIGKTTLLKAIARMEIEGFPRHHRVLHVRQEVNAGREGDGGSVLQAVIDSDVERNSLMKEEKDILKRLEKEEVTPVVNSVSGSSSSTSMDKREKLKALKENKGSQGETSSFAGDLKRLDEIYGRLAVIGADAAESRASMILSGLQFTPEMQAGPPSALSGGWRMRVSLAAALFIEPDLLMLDEPTNHLDLEAVLWLESYLVEYKHTIIIVSHDRGFLNEVCSDIIEFKNLKLTYYKGDYDTYVKTADDFIRNSMRVYQAYMDKRDHMMEFINKFRTNAKRASLVQSRIKAVEKMDMEAPEKVVVENVWNFAIPNPEPLGRPIISVDDVSFDYVLQKDDGRKKPESEWLLQKVNFGIDLSSKVGILGPNGAGKSTLLNLIMDKITPVRGSCSRNGRLRIGHFTQHSADKFDLQLSSVENMLGMFEHSMDQEMRSFLGRFQIQGTDALKPMMMLSGGQKSRVAFAALAYQKPHVIVMDEPTNHLDMESIDALVGALTDFRGGLMVVSHDQFFITKTCTELWTVGEGKATRFRGDFNEYKKHTLDKTAKRVAESVKSLSTMNNK